VKINTYDMDLYITEVREDVANGHPCFVAYNPELPGCMAQGNTWQEAVKSLKEARHDYIMTLLDEEMTVPLPSTPRPETIARPICGYYAPETAVNYATA